MRWNFLLGLMPAPERRRRNQQTFCCLTPIYLGRVRGEIVPPNSEVEMPRTKLYIKWTAASRIQVGHKAILSLFQLRRHFRRKIAFFPLNSFTESESEGTGDIDGGSQFFGHPFYDLRNFGFTINDKGLI